jgi:hypothetical protein
VYGGFKGLFWEWLSVRAKGRGGERLGRRSGWAGVDVAGRGLGAGRSIWIGLICPPARRRPPTWEATRGLAVSRMLALEAVAVDNQGLHYE